MDQTHKGKWRGLVGMLLNRLRELLVCHNRMYRSGPIEEGNSR